MMFTFIHPASFQKIMSTIYRSLLLQVAILFLPAVTLADNSDAYAKCQDACFGNGLSCVKKCMGEGDGNGSGEPAQGNSVAVEVDDGTTVDSELTPAEARRLRERAGYGNPPVAAERPIEAPIRRPAVGRR